MSDNQHRLSISFMAKFGEFKPIFSTITHFVKYMDKACALRESFANQLYLYRVIWVSIDIQISKTLTKTLFFKERFNDLI